METQNVLTNQYRRRRDLLPWWIKTCIWIFLIFGAIIPIAIIYALIGYNFKISLYGIETFKPLSIIGYSLMFLFLLKAIVAYGLWTEQDWAINIGILDTIIGILVCSFVMFIYPLINSASVFFQNIRLELLLLIPFLLKLLKIRVEWSTCTKKISQT